MPSCYFDVVTMWQVLEHVPFPSEVVKKSKQLLKDDGLLIVEVPNEGWCINALVEFSKNQLKRLLNKKGEKKYIVHTSRQKPAVRGREIHLSYFDTNTLCLLLTKHGFRIRDIDIGHARRYKRRCNLQYHIFRQIHKITGINLSRAILIVAQAT